jgi:hypothetical protein
LHVQVDHPDLDRAVSFVRTSDTIDPVSLVHSICKDAQSRPHEKKSRFIKRMTPMTLMRKTMSGGLEHVCQTVLRPHFHAGGPAKKVSKEDRLDPGLSARLRQKAGRFRLIVLVSCRRKCSPGLTQVYPN